MGFAQGFSVGYQAVEQARRNKEARTEKQKRDALDKDIRSIYEVDPARIESNTPTGEQMQRYDAENAALARQDAETFGTDASGSDYRYGTPKTSETVMRYGINGVEGETPDDARSAALERTLAKHGQYRDAMAVREKANSIKQGELGLERVKREEGKARAVDAFDSDLARMAKDSGGEPGMADITQAASRHGVGMDVVHDRMLKSMKISEARANEIALERKNQLRNAMAKGPDAMLAMHDPDPTDNIKPSFSTNKDGKLIVMYGDKPLFGNMAFADHLELGGYMASLIDKDPVAYAYGLREQELKRKKLESEIDENNANAASHRAQADKYGAESAQTRVETNRIEKGLGKGGDAPKVEGAEVSHVLGTPAVDRKGNPWIDPMTKKQGVQRNLAEENAFYRWMAKEGLTDTNAALLRWKAGAREGNMEAPPKPKPTKPFDAGAFFNN